MTIETRDLWQGSYLLAEGGWLAGMKVEKRPDGKKGFVFRLTGDGVEDQARQFMEGAATCNVRKLRRHMNHLRDLMFGGMHDDD